MIPTMMMKHEILKRVKYINIVKYYEKNSIENVFWKKYYNRTTNCKAFVGEMKLHTAFITTSVLFTTVALLMTEI